MTIFHIHGELNHLLAVVLLLGKICKFKYCTGISGKSQILLLSSSPPGIWTCSSTSQSTVMRWFFFSVPLSQCTWSMRSFENVWQWEWHILPGVFSGLCHWPLLPGELPWRPSGLSPSTWNQWPSSPSSSYSARLERPRPLLLATWYFLGCTWHFT